MDKAQLTESQRISLADTAALPSYSLQTLTYHEANPGHHLQTLLGLDPSLPILGTVFYSNAAGEGWGLCAERLMRAFHDCILEHGALPLNQMEAKIDAWIAGQI